MVTPIPPDPTGRGGIPLVLDGQLHALSRHHDVAVLTLAGPDAAELMSVGALRASGVDVQAVERHEPHGARRWQRRGRWASMWLRGGTPWRSVWFWDRRVQEALDRAVSAERFDLVAVEDNAMGAYRYGNAVPKVLTEHEVRRPRPMHRPRGGVESLPRWALSEWDWRRWPAYQRDTWRSFDRLHVFSARDAARVSDLAPDVHPRVRTVPFGLRLPSSASAADERADTLLFVGNFTHQPNVDGILWFVHAVLPEVRRSRERVRLTIAGSHPPDSVTSLAGDQIAVIPDPVVVEPLVAQCAVVLAPLRIGGGMRVKVAQALGHGKAVVSTTRAADGLPVDRGGLPLVISDDPSVLARETVHLLADADARRRLGLRARDYAEHHLSEAAYGRRLEESYTEVVESHRGRR